MNDEIKDNSPEEIQNEEKKDNKSKKIIILIIGILLIAVGVTMLFTTGVLSPKKAQDDTSKLTTVETTSLEQCPVDFAELQAQNEEIYAWINVPNTEVDYPVLQSATADDFYLKHSAVDKSYSASGAIYTQSLNTKSFLDRVTVIYGHNGYGSTFFTTLHSFEDEDFFNDNPYFYIYTPGEKRTYQVISAFKYDDRHILNSFNFNDNAVFEEFVDMIQNPTSSNKNVRTDLDKEITIRDNIVVLSTCITNQKSSRYLVCGVLVNNEKTN